MRVNADALYMYTNSVHPMMLPTLVLIHFHVVHSKSFSAFIYFFYFPVYVSLVMFV